MKTWTQLMIRQGFKVTEVENGIYDLTDETAENLKFLFNTLTKAGVSFHEKGDRLFIDSKPISESAWLHAIDFPGRGRGGDLWVRPGIDEPKVFELDTYISGIVRELNRLKIYTNGSCDGHGRRTPHVLLENEADREKAVKLLLAAGVKKVYSTRRKLAFPVRSRNQLLDAAEALHAFGEDWTDKDMEQLREILFYQTLEQLLSIDGESGGEEHVRCRVMEELADYVDFITTDRYGNILAQKTYRGGYGPTMLLNAHLDIAEGLAEDRKIIKNGPIWSSSKGILGADDRAGVAVILETAKRLAHSSFSGVVKFVFTVEEEIGLVGASAVEDYFLWDVDCAIVVDRRGSHDIVVSCGGVISFCHKDYGRFFEKAAAELGSPEWKMTPGGSSDTRIWAQHGIQSVNLSAGYRFEHTAQEELDVNACYGTVKLLESVFQHARELRQTLRDIKHQELTAKIIS